MPSMTYGTLPTFTEFEAAFDRECPHGYYRIHLSSSDAKHTEDFILGDGEFSAQGLYEACEEIITASQDCDERNVPVSHGDTCDVTSADLVCESSCPVCGRDVVYTLDGAVDLVASIMDTLGFEWI